jgi:hypothetical protein
VREYTEVGWCAPKAERCRRAAGLHNTHKHACRTIACKHTNTHAQVSVQLGDIVSSSRRRCPVAAAAPPAWASPRRESRQTHCRSRQGCPWGSPSCSATGSGSTHRHRPPGPQPRVPPPLTQPQSQVSGPRRLDAAAPVGKRGTDREQAGRGNDLIHVGASERCMGPPKAPRWPHRMPRMDDGKLKSQHKVVHPHAGAG